jgi:hypothetical protein
MARKSETKMLASWSLFALSMQSFRACRLVITGLVTSTVFFAAGAQADSGGKTIKFAVMRDDSQIGTNTVSVARNGQETVVQIVTHVEVTVAYVTLYRFDQTDTEHWADGHLLAMNATTDDNGTVHRTTANCSDGKVVVQGDGQITKLAADVIPASLWNPAILKRSVAFDPQNGNAVPVSVVDRGEDDLVIQGRAKHAHHYLLKTTFPQELWYDEDHQLVKVELKGSDGSTIRYLLD